MFFLSPTGQLAAAQDECNRDCVQSLVTQGTILSLGQLLAISGVALQGEILNAELFQRRENWYYIFRQFSVAENSVIHQFVDASTGEVVAAPPR